MHDPIEDGRIEEEMLTESTSHSGFEYHHGLVVAARGAERIHLRKNRCNDLLSGLRTGCTDDVDDSCFTELLTGLVSLLCDSIGKQEQAIAFMLPRDLTTGHVIDLPHSLLRRPGARSIRCTSR